MEQYREGTLTGATGIDLVVALYDGAIQSLHRAIQCVAERDEHGRRNAIKRVVDILMYLQARLRPEFGAKTASALGDFYAAMFTMTLEASHHASAEHLQEVILCLRNVRDAWMIVARDPEAGKVLPRELRTAEERQTSLLAAAAGAPEDIAQRWSA